MGKGKELAVLLVSTFPNTLNKRPQPHFSSPLPFTVKFRYFFLQLQEKN